MGRVTMECLFWPFFVFGCYITQVEILHGIYGRRGLDNRCNHSSNANGGGN